MFRGMTPTQRRIANIDFLEKMVKEGIEVNGCGKQKFDGSEKEYLILNYIYICGLTPQKGEKHLKLLIDLRRLTEKKFSTETRIFDPESEKLKIPSWK